MQGRLFRHLLIDEMQDTNAVQVAVVESIAAAGAGNLTAVGDDAQSIYRFRGADYDNILRFAERHPGARIFHLETNYRSTPQIVAFTRASIAHNQTGFPKELVSARPDGVLPLVVSAEDAYDEAAFICEQILEERDKGRGTRADGGPLPQSSRQHPAPGRAARARHPLHACAAACGSSSRRTSRTCWPTCGSWSTPATRPRGVGCCC